VGKDMHERFNCTKYGPNRGHRLLAADVAQREQRPEALRCVRKVARGHMDCKCTADVWLWRGNRERRVSLWPENEWE